MKTFARLYKQTAEFLARQGQLFGSVAQSKWAEAKAELRANLARLKRQWTGLFPKAAPYFQQLVLEADDFHQLGLLVDPNRD